MPAEWATSELIDRCLVRPADELVWQEFVRRFHLTIQAAVLKTLEREAGPDVAAGNQYGEQAIDDLVQAVYFRLVEHRSRALRLFKDKHPGSINQYLMMISIRVVQDYFHLNAPRG